MNSKHNALASYPPTGPYESETHQLVLRLMREYQRPIQVETQATPAKLAYDTTLAELSGATSSETLAMQSELINRREQLALELTTVTAKLHAVHDSLEQVE